MYLFFTSKTFEQMHCLGAPYLYVTFHSNVNGPVKYSRDGCSLTGNVLKGFQVNPGDSFRSMAISSDNNIFIIESIGKGRNTSGSRITEYGQCGPNGLRSFKSQIMYQPAGNTQGADHPYGIALSNGANGTVNRVYASFQNTDVVLGFDNANRNGLYSPMRFPRALSRKKKISDYYPGTFYQFGKPGYQKRKNQGVRSISLVGENLWIANEKKDLVVIVDPQGYTVAELQLRKPIGMHYSSDHNLVFVSSRSSYGVVVAYDATTKAVIQRYHIDGMTHPTGVVSYESTLYILEQALGVMYAFNIGTGDFIKVVFSGLAKKGLEQIVLSSC